MKRSRRSDCPINFALQTFGDTWSLLIIRDLMFFGKKYYGDFLKSEEGIATNILADRLLRLEKAGLVGKTPHIRDKRKDLYELSEKGVDLLPMLVEMILWSAKYDPKTGAPKAFVARARRDKKGLLSEIIGGSKYGGRVRNT